jgi:hypothetical protein
MSDKSTYNVFLPSGCLSAESMKRHKNGKLSGRDHDLVNAHLQHCELCADAYEGIKGVTDEVAYDRAISTIKKDFRKRLIARKTILPRDKKLKRVHTHRAFSYVAMAAAVLAMFMVYNFLEARESQTKIFGEQFVEDALFEPLPPLPRKEEKLIAMEQGKEPAGEERITNPGGHQPEKPLQPVSKEDVAIVGDDIVMEEMEEQETRELVMDERAAFEEAVIEPADDQEMAYAQLASEEQAVFVEKSVPAGKEGLLSEEKPVMAMKRGAAKGSAMGTAPAIANLDKESKMKMLFQQFYHREYQNNLSDTLKETIGIQFYLDENQDPARVQVSGSDYPYYFKSKVVELFGNKNFKQVLGVELLPVGVDYQLDSLELALPQSKIW